MDLNRLRELGGIVSSIPVKREVSWGHLTDTGEEVTDTFTVHIRKHSCGTMERFHAARDAQDKSGPALIISESVLLGEDGAEPIPYDVAFQLDTRLARVLIDAINEVNGFGGITAKN